MTRSNGRVNNKKNGEKNIWLIDMIERIPHFLAVVFAVYMIVTLLMNAILNNKMNRYYRPNYLIIPSEVWLCCAVALLALILWIINFCTRKICLSEKQFYIFLIINFVVIYLIQLFISRNIYFKTGWDAGVLIDNAENIALNGADGVELDYFSWYPNNIFAVYTLVFFYKIAVVVHKQNPYIVIFAINNLLVNISVLLATLSIYKITNKKSVTIVSMVFGVILIGLSPWIVIPYTDTLGMIFPIGAVFCYVFLKNRYLRYFLFVALCEMGYLYKPTVLIGVIALVIIKSFSLLKRLLHNKLKLKMLVKTSICILMAALCVAGLNKAVIGMNTTELDENKAMTMTHYFMMGLNKTTEGVYSRDDVNYSISFGNKDMRKKGNIEVIKQRYQEMGASGYITQLVKKNLSNYNDGTFAWYREGNFFVEIPEKDSLAAKLLRRFYWWNQVGEENMYQVFASIEQVVWFFVLLCIAGCVLPGCKINNVEGLLALTLIGVSLFLLLFECRARYLYIFSPLYVVLAGIGLDKINYFLHDLRRNNMKTKGEK